jgi:hypothetical protein
VRKGEVGDFIAPTLWKVSVDEAEEDFLAQTLLKMREAVQGDFLAQTLRKVREERDFLEQTLRKVS